MYKIFLISLLFLLSCNTEAPKPAKTLVEQIPEPVKRPVLKPNVYYSVEYPFQGGPSFGVLKAKVRDKTYTLVSARDSMCLSIDQINDYDMNGYSDAMINDILACGGNAVPPSQFVVMFDGKRFHFTRELHDDYGSVSVDSTENGFTFSRITDSDFLDKFTMCDGPRETYIIENFEFKRIKREGKLPHKLLAEVYQPYVFGMDTLLLFDLDYDLKMDTMRYIEEEGITTEKWEVKFGNGKHASEETYETRIGVLKTKTMGVHDLLFGCDEIRKWNGKKYR